MSINLLFAQTEMMTNGELNTTTNNAVFEILGGILVALILFFLVPLVIITIAEWKIFLKGGRPGWIALIPVYNLWVLFEMAGRPGWWSLLLLTVIVPGVNFITIPIFFVLSVMAYIDLAKSFGKSSGFGVLLAFIPIIGFPILGFGSAQYQGPAGPEKVAGAAAANPNMPNQQSMMPPQAPQQQPGGMSPSPYAQAVQAQEQPQQQPQQVVQPPSSQPQQTASAQPPANMQQPQPQQLTQDAAQPQSFAGNEGQQPPTQPPTA